MSILKRAAVAVTGLLLAGTSALAMSAITPTAATTKATALHSGNGGGGGGGGGTIYNPVQNYSPIIILGKL